MVPYRIVASSDGTRLDYDPAVPPGAPTTMNAGDVATFSSGTGDAFVVRTQDSEHPIYVAAYMTGADGDGRDAKNYAGRGDADQHGGGDGRTGGSEHRPYGVLDDVERIGLVHGAFSPGAVRAPWITSADPARKSLSQAPR